MAETATERTIRLILEEGAARERARLIDAIAAYPGLSDDEKRIVTNILKQPSTGNDR